MISMKRKVAIEPSASTAKRAAGPTSSDEKRARNAAALARIDATQTAKRALIADLAGDEMRGAQVDGNASQADETTQQRKRGPPERPQFPQPLRFNGKKYYRRSDLDYFKLTLEAFALCRRPPPKPASPAGDALLPHGQVAKEFGCTPRSIDRWAAAAAEAKAAECREASALLEAVVE